MLGLRRWYKLPEVQPHGGGDMIAQHAAGRGPRSAPLLRASGWEGGVLGKAGKRFESPGDDRGSHTDSYDPRRSCSNSFFLRSMPQRYPASCPSMRTTRWQGTASATGLFAHAVATARTAFGSPIARATSL